MTNKAKQSYYVFLHAVRAGKVVMVECEDKATGKPTSVLCIVLRDDKGKGKRMLLPVGEMFDAPAFDRFYAPNDEDDVACGCPDCCGEAEAAIGNEISEGGPIVVEDRTEDSAEQAPGRN